MLESKIVLSTLLRRFKFEVSANTKPPVIATQLVLKSMNGINLIVSRRWTVFLNSNQILNISSDHIALVIFAFKFVFAGLSLPFTHWFVLRAQLTQFAHLKLINFRSSTFILVPVIYQLNRPCICFQQAHGCVALLTRSLDLCVLLVKLCFAFLFSSHRLNIWKCVEYWYHCATARRLSDSK